MSNIPSYLPIAQQPTAAAPSQAVIPAPPPGLTRLSAGALVEGTVIGRTPQGLLAVKTSHGELALRTSASPPVQSRVVLQLQPSGGQFRVILLSVKPAQDAPGQKAAPPRPGGQPAASPPPAAAAPARAAPPSAAAAPVAQARASVVSGATPSNTPPATGQARPTPLPGAPPPAQPQGQPASGQPAGQALPAAGRPAPLTVTPGTPGPIVKVDVAAFSRDSAS